MPDLKVLIGGRSYNISCNPGEENATNESANLLDKEAELIQSQLGRLTDEKMLLLSGLLLGNKLREMKQEKLNLEETLKEAQSRNNNDSRFSSNDASSTTSKLSDKNLEVDKTDSIVEVKALQNISDLLDGLIKVLEKSDLADRNTQSSKDSHGGTQESFL